MADQIGREALLGAADTYLSQFHSQLWGGSFNLFKDRTKTVEQLCEWVEGVISELGIEVV